jgi:hypothetical protein
MPDNNIILEKDFKNDEIRDVINTQFRGLAKKYFQLDTLKESDHLKLLKESSRFFSFSLPDEINEIFIKYEEAPLFWVFRSPVILYLEKFYASSQNNSRNQNYYKSARDFYTKWLLNKNENEKKYFAVSVLNILERQSNSNNILNFILQAIVLGYDNNVLNFSKAIELLEKTEEMINEQKLHDNIKQELRYLICLYRGFIQMRQNENENALENFAEAVSLKPFGVTAKFYREYNNSILYGNSLDNEILHDLYSYDIARIEYSIDKNDLSMMDYLINNAVIHNLFYYPELTGSYTAIYDFLSGINSTLEYDLNKLKADLYNFKNLRINEYLHEENLTEISFLEKIFKSYINDENIFFKGISGKLHQKFRQIVENIVNAINQKYYDEIKEKLKIYVNEIEYKTSDLELIKQEHDKLKIRIKERLHNTINGIEERAANDIAYFEKRIENLQNEQGCNPKVSFKNAMTYNIILSFTTFLMGGCAEYSNTFMSETSKFSQFFPVVVISGFKWGVIAFTIGLVISLITAGLSILEGTNQKQKLLRAINRIKDDKDYQIEYYKKESARTEKESEDKFKVRIEEKKKYIDKLKTEKDEQEKKHLEEIEKNVQDEIQPLLALIS